MRLCRGCGPRWVVVRGAALRFLFVSKFRARACIGYQQPTLCLRARIMTPSGNTIAKIITLLFAQTRIDGTRLLLYFSVLSSCLRKGRSTTDRCAGRGGAGNWRRCAGLRIMYAYPSGSQLRSTYLDLRPGNNWPILISARLKLEHQFSY